MPEMWREIAREREIEFLTHFYSLYVSWHCLLFVSSFHDCTPNISSLHIAQTNKWMKDGGDKASARVNEWEWVKKRQRDLRKYDDRGPE